MEGTFVFAYKYVSNHRMQFLALFPVVVFYFAITEIPHTFLYILAIHTIFIRLVYKLNTNCAAQ